MEEKPERKLNNNRDNNKYISLQEATKFCNYSQDYLSLRARQKKLKAKKIGRNWMTTKEWVDEYSKEVKDKYISLQEATKFCNYSQEYLSLRARQKKLKAKKIGRNWMTTQKWIDEYSKGAEDYKNNLVEKKKELEKVEIPSCQPVLPRTMVVAMALVFVLTFIGTILGYLYFEPEIKLVTEVFKEKSNEIVSDIREFTDNLGENLYNSLSKTYKFLVGPWKREIAGEEFLKQIKEIEKIKEELARLEREGIIAREIVKEVTQITQIIPIKEITKEIIKIDDEELKRLKIQVSQIQGWEKDIQTLQILTNKLQTHPPYTQVTTAPVYIGSQGLQVGGAATFSSLVVSGLVGINNLGVGGSATLGSDSSDTLKVYATANFISPVSLTNSFRVGDTTDYLTIGSDGSLTTTGDVSIGGDLTLSGNLVVSGTQTFSDILTLTASSTSPALSVSQNGSGDLVVFNLNGTEKFKIDSTGNILLTGDIIITGSATTTGSMYAATFYSSSTDSTVRKSGEEVFRGSASIYRYEMPAQTSTTTYFRISKYFSQNPLASSPPTLPGTNRVYRLVIKYADDVATSSVSDWRIYRPSQATTTDSFTLSGLAASNLEEGEPYITEILNIPDSDWQVELKLASTTEAIRISQIYLAAYDQLQ